MAIVTCSDVRSVLLMKKFMDAIKVIILPLQITLFLLACLAATLLSGLIEILVMRDVLTVPSLGVLGQCVPIVMVIVMEILKLFLLFFSKRLLQAGRQKEARNLKLVSLLLIFFSFFCTLFYTANALYDEGKVAQAFETDQEIVEEQYNNKIQKLQEENEEKTQRRLKHENKMVKSAQKSYDNYKLIYRPKAVYKRTKKMKQDLYNKLEKAKKDYDKKTKEIEAEQQEELEEKIKALESERGLKNTENKESFSVQSAGDNPYIKNALMFMAAFLGRENGEYSRHAYYIIVILVSIIAASVLELAIKIEQDFLAMDDVLTRKVFKTEENISQELSEEREKFCSRLLESMVMAGVFMVIGLCGAFVFNINMVLTAFGSFFFAVTAIHGKEDVEWNKGLDNITDNLKALYSTERLQTQAIQILITVTVFVVISIFIVHTTEDVMPASVALTVGSVTGNLVFTKFQGA